MARVFEGWWEFLRWSDEYEQGTDRYIEHALATKSQGDEICCPCTLCYRYWHYGNGVKDHIICNGFIPRTNDLLEVRKDIHSEKKMFENNEPINMNDGMQELLHDTFREGPNEEAKKFLNLIEEGQEELFPGCKTFSKLSFIIRLFIYKCDHKLSNVAFSAFLDLLRELLPDAKLPSSFHEANKMLKSLGLDYIKIDAFPNNCMLYWEEHANATCCHVCGTPRWKSNGKNKDMGEPNRKTHRIPKKFLRYFPIKKRLQRLYMCGDIAKMMTWHAEGREKDGLLRHPTDGHSWKDFDKIYPNLTKEPRNVRLGLATDGFNPFHTMSIVHSTCPVILINYNLPPWMATKSEFLMLSLLIPCPSSPGNSINIYLQPPVKDLEDLWEFELETYDASSNKMFDMHVALMSTINDFPAYAMLSGWSTKGKLACPCCHYETNYKWLDHSRKECYMDNRVFLDSSHPWRHNRTKFNGKIEERLAPNRLNGVEIEELLRDFPNEFGKKDKRRKQVQDDPNPWRKFPILFRLPYWKHCSLRNNLDVMHIEKNVFDNVIRTLLDIPGKTKDHEAARRDLRVLGIMPELQIKELEDGSEQSPPARFWMTPEQKRLFCKTIKNAKLPKGYASNISKCVQDQEGRITGYESHDAHFMMHYLLPISVNTTLNKDVAIPLQRLSNFFRGIWKKVINPKDLENLHSKIVEFCVSLSKFFHQLFFNIMVHLPNHLVEEIKLSGPVASRCMYAITRYLRELKLDVRNKGRPEGSMAEGYLAKECSRLCARYLKRTESSTHNSAKPCVSQSFLPKIGHPIRGKGKSKKKEDSLIMIDQTTWAQAHR